jgi:hypothetical protein
MTLIKNLFAGSVLAAAVATSQAAIVTPGTAGGSELFAVLYTLNNQVSLILDLSVTITNFAIDTNQTFNLAASPYYSQFLSNNAAFPVANGGPSTVQYAVMGFNSNGITKQLWVTGPANTTPATVTNSTLVTRTGNMNTFVIAVNSSPNSGGFNNGHIATDGSSLDTTSGAVTSFSTLSANLSSALIMVNAESSAELFRYVTSGPSNPAASTRTDFFSETETADNLG